MPLFKAMVGPQAHDGIRKGSFCSHVILGRDLFVVADAASDSRFAGLPSVAGEPRFRFYAGMPLLTSDGAAIGTLAVMDVTSRSLSLEQRVVLETLSQKAMGMLEERRVAMVRGWIVSGIDRELQSGIARLRSLASSVLRPGTVDNAKRMIEILAETERLDDLLDTMRDLTRLGLGEPQPLQLQRTDVRVLCEEVIEELAAGRARRRGPFLPTSTAPACASISHAN